MKRITFIRHYKLSPPFDHWTNMSFEQFVNFSKGVANPAIDPSIETVLKENHFSFKNFDLIVTSTKRRTKETAVALVSYLGDHKLVQSSKLFDEIPLKILDDFTEAEWEGVKKKGVLNVKKVRVLTDQEKLKRIKEIDKYLLKLSGKEILVISHSYLIGLLNYWFNVAKRDLGSFNFNEMEKHEIGGVLKGFTISTN